MYIAFGKVRETGAVITERISERRSSAARNIAQDWASENGLVYQGISSLVAFRIYRTYSDSPARILLAEFSISGPKDEETKRAEAERAFWSKLPNSYGKIVLSEVWDNNTETDWKVENV